MRHFLAYGNSDQSYFRDSQVLESFDFMTVPGTIAAYYPDATAGFVLSSQLDYVIDPRTPLFQGRIAAPRASHFSLARWLGPQVEVHMGDPTEPHAVEFTPQFYSPSVIEEAAVTLVERQSGYGGRSQEIQEKYDHYHRLMAEALGEAENFATGSKPPSFVLSPYFASLAENDLWWGINIAFWEACARVSQTFSPVVAVGSPKLLEPALATARQHGKTAFYWVTGLNERKASEAELTDVAAAVSHQSSELQLINLYGGYFSICLGKVGLWGFNNGLGYSESRSWPDLPSTGAAPPRYYVPSLHAFLAPATAQQIANVDPAFRCSCSVCGVFSRRRIIQMTPSEMKRHFAVCRRAESAYVDSSDLSEIATSLTSVADTFEALAIPALPERLVPDVRYLRTWARVLRSI
jgi:hypothetical protein